MMKHLATRIGSGLLLLIVVAGPASAALRSPQVPVLGGTLQGYFNSQGEAINVNTDQQDIQSWLNTNSGTSTFTLQVELSGNAAGNSIGLYNAGFAAPPLYLVFPGAATNGWFATATFRTLPQRLVVNLFDNNANFVGSTTYLAGPPDPNNFGFWLQGPGTGGVFYTQDARNPGGLAQALTYAGTGRNSGSWWLAFEDTPRAGVSDSDFDDAVLFLESVNPVPVHATSWGALKARFH